MWRSILKSLNDGDFKKKIISRTLCKASSRANCQSFSQSSLNMMLHLQLSDASRSRTSSEPARTIPPYMGMSYNSARDELFLADYDNKVVRAIRVRDNAGDLRDVYRAPHDTNPSIWSVCHMSDSDTLLVCSSETGRTGRRRLAGGTESRGSEWREAQRVQTRRKRRHVLRAEWLASARRRVDSTSMELFRVESGPIRIARLHRIHVPEVQVLPRDERQRHARGDVLRDWPVGARVSTARRPARGTRAHPVEEATSTPVARWSTARHRMGRRQEIARRHRARSERHATRTPPPTPRQQRAHRVQVGVQWTTGSQSLMTTQKTCCSTCLIINK